MVVVFTGRIRRAERLGATRESLLTAAERLFAEHGVHAVANRQISEAAGQGDNAAVAYRFGPKIDLVRAIVRNHDERIEEGRACVVAEIGGSSEVRDRITGAIRLVTEHLESLGSPSWCARFIAQVAAGPVLHDIVVDAFHATSRSLDGLHEGLNRCLPSLPSAVHDERAAMARHLILHACAERERALAANAPTFRESWYGTAAGLTDAIVAAWQAPVGSG